MRDLQYVFALIYGTLSISMQGLYYFVCRLLSPTFSLKKYKYSNYIFSLIFEFVFGIFCQCKIGLQKLSFILKLLYLKTLLSILTVIFFLLKFSMALLYSRSNRFINGFCTVTCSSFTLKKKKVKKTLKDRMID